jgi:predicted DNA-binding transcriptional regulator AlpA
LVLSFSNMENDALPEKPDRFLRLSGVQSIVPLARSAIYAEMEHGFPRPVKITAATGKSAAVAWSENAVLSWVERKLAEGRAAAAAAPAGDVSPAIEALASSNDAGEV